MRTRKPKDAALPPREDDPSKPFFIDAEGFLVWRDGRSPEDMYLPGLLTTVAVIMVLWCLVMLVLHLP